MGLSAKEIEVMSNKGIKDRYVYCIKRIVDSEQAWVLDNDGFALCGQNDVDNEVIMLWSAREYAANCALDDWKGYKPKALSLDFVMNELLPDLSEKKIQVGIFPIPTLRNTPVVNAKDLLHDLENLCSEYF